MYHIITNPTAGVKRGARVLKKLETFLKAENVPYEIYQSTHTGHPAQIASQICESLVDEYVIKIVVIGGDGTFNEVLNGIGDDMERVQLGFIRAGRGNDFAKFMLIPKNVVSAFKVILADNRRKIDIYEIDDSGEKTYGLNVCGTGLDVEVIKAHSRAKLFKKSKIAYQIAVFKGIKRYKPCKVKISINEGEEKEYEVLFVSVANGKSYGGGMQVAPKASVFDGKLDVVVVPMMPKWKVPFKLFDFFRNGNFIKRGTGVHEYAKEVKIEYTDDRKMVVNTDGQLVKKAFDVKVLPAKLQVFCTEQFITNNKLEDEDYLPG